MRRLIINADGFGFAPGVNSGIVETFRAGLVKSTSCVVNFPFIEDLPDAAAEFPSVSFGVHLNLSVGRPISPLDRIPTLVSLSGTFWGPHFTRRLLTGRIRSTEIELELTAQFQRMIDLGVRPTHWDGHQNKHLFPLFHGIGMRVAKSFGVTKLRSHRRYLVTKKDSNRRRSLSSYYLSHPKQILTHLAARVQTLRARRNGFRTADRLITPGYVDQNQKAMAETWLMIAEILPVGVSEIYCHPGYPDEHLRSHAAYVEERASEIEVLCSLELSGVFAKQGIELISFNDL